MNDTLLDGKTLSFELLEVSLDFQLRASTEGMGKYLPSLFCLRFLSSREGILA